MKLPNFLNFADKKKSMIRTSITSWKPVVSTNKSFQLNGKTLFDKVWMPMWLTLWRMAQNFVHRPTFDSWGNKPTSLQGTRRAGHSIFRPNQIVATADHNMPTLNQHLPVKDLLSRNQLKQLSENCEKHGITLYALGHQYNGIVHVMAPELGITQPGMTIVCGDSHTSTHGAFGTIAFGIRDQSGGPSFASQCLLLTKPKSLRITVNGTPKKGVLPKMSFSTSSPK